MRIGISLCLITLFCCESPAQKDKLPTAPSNMIFDSKVTLFLESDSCYIQANRLSSTNPYQLKDTLHLQVARIKFNNSASPFDTVIYKLNALKGEQIETASFGGVRLSLREASVAYLKMVKGLAHKVKTNGEVFIDTDRSIELYPLDNITLKVDRGSKVLIENYDTQKVRISLLKGFLETELSALGAGPRLIYLREGKDLIINTQTKSCEMEDCFLSNGPDWQHAGTMNFEEAEFTKIMTTIDNWHRTHTIFNTYPDGHYTFTLFYSSPVDSVLKLFQALGANITSTRRNDTIFISSNKK